jgi:hypothetical protein
VRTAIVDACKVVAERYGSPGDPLGVKHPTGGIGRQGSVEHSSHGLGEEWGAPGDGDDQSTATGAPPLTGSGTPEKEAPGVGAMEAGGRDGRC